MKIEELYDRMINCQDCGLCENRTQVVLSAGPPNASVMLVGEGPGAEEDLSGRPFEGKAGQKLNSMLKYAGLEREDVFITNSVYCRPPNNRNPNLEELAACRWRLIEEIKIVRPEVIVILGKIALEQLLGHQIERSLSSYFRDEFQEIDLGGDLRVKTLITYHPSFLLRRPDYAYNIVLPHWRLMKEWVVIKIQKKNSGNL